MANRDKMLRHMRERLQRRRRDLLVANEHARRELAGLKEADKDPEYEESAQTELADYTLSQVIENQRRELLMIDAAFQRMDQDSFGTCVDCGLEIAFERLEAVPFAIRCEEDARQREQERVGGHSQIPTM